MDKSDGWTRRGALAALASTVLAPRLARAQSDYPNRPITLVVGFPAGGFTDVIARALGTPMSAALGRPIIVENQSGAAGTIAAARVARSEADGYTILMGHVTANAAAGALMPQLPYNPATAFKPVTLAGTQPHAVLVSPKSGIASIQDLISRAKGGANLTYASSGNGSLQHLAGELFNRLAGTKLTHIPYRGSAPALTDVVGGQVTVAFDGVGSAQSLLESKMLIPIAVTTRERVARFPDVPTLAEAGLTNYEMASWFGLFVPANTPDAIVTRIYDVSRAALQTPAVQKILDDAAAKAGGQPPAEFNGFVQGEIRRLGDFIRAAGITIT